MGVFPTHKCTCDDYFTYKTNKEFCFKGILIVPKTEHREENE